MAENSTLDNRTIDDLYLTNGISEDGLKVLIGFIFVADFHMIVPIFIITVLYMVYKLVINRRCKYYTELTPTGIVCEQSKTKKARFCRYVERWTVWLLVDLFHTPNVEIEMENNKVHLKVLKKRSLAVGEKVPESTWLFACISFIFCLYIQKFIADFVLKLTPTCIDKGDFGIPAACYALSTSYLDYSLSTSETSYQINCTTWNDNLELFGKEIGLLHCFSFYYNILSSVTEIMGLFGLQTVVVQLTLIIAEKCTLLVDKHTQGVTRQVCNQRCIAILIVIIALVGFGVINSVIPLLIEITDPMNKKRFHEVAYQQLLPTVIAYLSTMLAMLLMLITAADDKTTKKTRNTKEHDEEPLEENTPM